MAETKKTTKEEVKLNPKVWELPFNGDLVAQVLYVYSSNERKGTSNAKTRGDVSGGGRKPWKQKGTGRARQGSVRSPLWVGGGVTFVPNNKNWRKNVNKKMVKKATCIMLSKRFSEEAVDFLNMNIDSEMKEIRSKFVKSLGKKTILVSQNEKVNLAMRNISSVSVVDPMKLNVKDIVNARKLLVDQDSVKILEDRLTNGK